ncbi:MAG: hypothetical protein Kow0054_04020 [Deferrisoma sp.]
MWLSVYLFRVAEGSEWFGAGAGASPELSGCPEQAVGTPWSSAATGRSTATGTPLRVMVIDSPPLHGPEKPREPGFRLRHPDLFRHFASSGNER